jgi:hypothetical protein
MRFGGLPRHLENMMFSPRLIAELNPGRGKRTFTRMVAVDFESEIKPS